MFRIKIAYCPAGWIRYPPLGGAQDLGSFRQSLKNHQISSLFPIPSKSLKVSPRSPKDTKMTPKTIPQDSKLLNKWEKWNHSKSQFLLWFEHIQTLHSGIISIPGSPKTWTWKLTLTLVAKIMEKSTNMYKVGPRRLPKCILKSIKMDTWTPMCPLGVPLDPWITKVVPRVPNMEPQGLQNDSFKYKSDPFQQSASQQFPTSKGAGGRGEALRFAAPPKGEPGVLDYSAAFSAKSARGFPDEVHPCRRPLPKLNQKVSKNRTWKKVAFLGPKGSKMYPKGHPKSKKNDKNAPKDPSRIGLETQCGKSRLPDSPRDPLMCWKHSPCHGFYTSHRIPPGSLWAPFWVHFRTLLAPVAPQGRSRDEKEPFQKSVKKRHGKGCPKVSKMTSEMGRHFRPRAPFLPLWSHLRSRWGPDPILAPFCIKIY